MKKTKNITYKPLPKQQEFINSNCKETLFSGAWGASKSYALCLAILKESLIPNAQILLCRKTYTALKRSTLQTLLYGQNPIIPNGAYKFNKMDQTITLNGLNSVIYLMGLDDIMKVRSMNLSMVAVDEASELDLSDWMELIGRLRCVDGSRRIIAATNPEGPGHWLYKRFFIEINKNRKSIRTSTIENTHLPPDYIESLKTLPKQLYDKFVLGEWVNLENAVYGEFSRDIHIKTRTLGEFNKYYLGVDFGFTNPCALVFIGVDGDNNIHLIEEQKESKLLISKIVRLAERYRLYNPVVVVDPSAPALIAEFENEGFNVKKADNTIGDGIARMQNYIHLNKFSIDPTCLEFIKEVENYIYDDKGKPYKENDHLLDATRYCCNELVAKVVAPQCFTRIIGEEAVDEYGDPNDY